MSNKIGIRISTVLTNNEWYFIITIISITLITLTLALYFWYRLKKLKINDSPRGFVLLVQKMMSGLNHLVNNSVGPRFQFLTPYVLYILLYINMANLLSILGAPFIPPLTNVFLILSLGIIVLFGIIAFTIRFKKWKTILHFLNPLEWSSLISSLISISFRLLGNLFVGYLLFSLVYGLFTYENIYPVNHFYFLAILLSPLHLYFDVFIGILQSFVYVILMLTYWSLSRNLELEQKDKITQNFQELKSVELK